MSNPLADYLLALADDELILGHRVSEWCGHAPILEEDIAFANIALDEIGHARLWLELAAKELGEDPATYPDEQTFFRASSDFRNLPLAELPNGDWAFSMLRQYVFDSYEIARLEVLKKSPHSGLTELATKVYTEELYHFRHTQGWVTRLAQGTDESRRRSQVALDTLWYYAQQFATPLPGEGELHSDKVVPNSAELFDQWNSQQSVFFAQIGLVPPTETTILEVDRYIHTQHLSELLEDMQQVARLEPEGRW